MVCIDFWRCQAGMCCGVVGLYQPAIDVWSSAEWCWKRAKAGWFWVILSLCPVTWEESVNIGLCLWLFGWPHHGLSGCQWCAAFSRKEFVDVLLSLSCHFADSSKRNSAFSRNRRLEPNLNLRRSSVVGETDVYHLDICHIVEHTGHQSSHHIWTGRCGYFFPDVEPCCNLPMPGWSDASFL